MSIDPNQVYDEAQHILDSLRKIQEAPELRTEAETNPESALNRLGLSGVARHAVALGITVLALGAAGPVRVVVSPNGFWL